MFKILFILVLLVSIGCSQTFIPRALIWDYDYSNDDSLDIKFDVFYGYGMLDTAFVLLDSTQTREMNILDIGFNTNTFKYFFCRARRISDGAVSLNSDTIDVWFPRILDNVPYQFQAIKMKLPKE
jgi:hypothetical protein